MVRENPHNSNTPIKSEAIKKTRALFASQLTSVLDKEKDQNYKEKVDTVHKKMLQEIEKTTSKMNSEIIIALKIPIITYERSRNFWIETKEEFKEILDDVFIRIFRDLKIIPRWDSEKDNRDTINKQWKDVSLEDDPTRQRKISIIVSEEKRYIEVHCVKPKNKTINLARIFPNNPARVEWDANLTYNNINQYPGTQKNKIIFQTKSWHWHDWIDCYWKVRPCNKLDSRTVKIWDGIRIEKVWDDDTAYYSTKDWIIALDTIFVNKKEIVKWIKILDNLETPKIAYNPNTKHIIENYVNIKTWSIIGYLINTKKWDLIAQSLVWWVDIQGSLSIKETEGPPIWKEEDRIIKANWNINLQSVNTNTVYSNYWWIKISKKIKNSSIKGHFIIINWNKEEWVVIEKSAISTNSLFISNAIFWSETNINMWVNFLETTFNPPENNELNLIKNIEDIDLDKRKTQLEEEIKKTKSDIEKTVKDEKTQLDNNMTHFETKIIDQNSVLLKNLKENVSAQLLLKIKEYLDPFKKDEIVDIINKIRNNLFDKWKTIPDFLWKYEEKALSISVLMKNIEEKTKKLKEKLKKLKEEFTFIEYKLNKDIIFAIEWELKRWATLSINYWWKELQKFEYSDNEKENFIKFYQKYNPWTGLFENISRDEAIYEIKRIWTQTQELVRKK